MHIDEYNKYLALKSDDPNPFIEIAEEDYQIILDGIAELEFQTNQYRIAIESLSNSYFYENKARELRKKQERLIRIQIDLYSISAIFIGGGLIGAGIVDDNRTMLYTGSILAGLGGVGRLAGGIYLAVKF